MSVGTSYICYIFSSLGFYCTVGKWNPWLWLLSNNTRTENSMVGTWYYCYIYSSLRFYCSVGELNTLQWLLPSNTENSMVKVWYTYYIFTWLRFGGTVLVNQMWPWHFTSNLQKTQQKGCDIFLTPTTPIAHGGLIVLYWTLGFNLSPGIQRYRKLSGRDVIFLLCL